MSPLKTGKFVETLKEEHSLLLKTLFIIHKYNKYVTFWMCGGMHFNSCIFGYAPVSDFITLAQNTAFFSLK